MVPKINKIYYLGFIPGLKSHEQFPRKEISTSPPGVDPPLCVGVFIIIFKCFYPDGHAARVWKQFQFQFSLFVNKGAHIWAEQFVE